MARDSARVYVYRCADSGRDQIVQLNATNHPAVALHASQWSALTWHDRRQELKVCVKAGTGTETCRAFVPDFIQPTYLECTVPPDGGPAVLRPVLPKEGLYELRRIQRLAKPAKELPYHPSEQPCF